MFWWRFVKKQGRAGKSQLRQKRPTSCTAVLSVLFAGRSCTSGAPEKATHHTVLVPISEKGPFTSGGLLDDLTGTHLLNRSPLCNRTPVTLVASRHVYIGLNMLVSV